MEHLRGNITPQAEIRSRIAALREKLTETDTDAALIVQNTDLFYFSGTIQQAHLYVPRDGEELLMVRKDLERARSESAIENIEFLKSPKQIPELLKKFGHEIPQSLGMELDVLPASLYFNYRKIFDKTRLSDISHPIRLIRAVKSDYEISQIRTAAHLADEVTATVKNFLKEGITEVELAGKIEAEARKRGHQGIVRMRMFGGELFYGHIMAGASAAVPSFLASPTGGSGVSPAVAQNAGFHRISRHEPVLVDYTFVHQGYISDQTRIFALGEIDPELNRAHSAMLALQEKIKKAARPGVTGGELFEMAVDYVDALGYADYFMGVGDQRIKFVGHGVGLELDEYPFLAKGQTQPLEVNMAVALEPKLIFPGKGVVGIENTHVVTAEGLEQLGRHEEGITLIPL